MKKMFKSDMSDCKTKAYAKIGCVDQPKQILKTWWPIRQVEDWTSSCEGVKISERNIMNALHQKVAFFHAWGSPVLIFYFLYLDTQWYMDKRDIHSVSRPCRQQYTHTLFIIFAYLSCHTWSRNHMVLWFGLSPPILPPPITSICMATIYVNKLWIVNPSKTNDHISGYLRGFFQTLGKN